MKTVAERCLRVNLADCWAVICPLYACEVCYCVYGASV